MRRNAHQASKFAFPCDESHHSIFHPAIAALHHAVLLIRIGTNMRVIKIHQCCRQRLKFLPIFNNFRLVFIEKMKCYSLRSRIGVVDVIGVCSPGKIVYFWGPKMPSKHPFFRFTFFGFTISFSNILGILKIATGCHGIVFINRDFNLIIAPNTMIFAS